jgi:hypothetical protein
MQHHQSAVSDADIDCAQQRHSSSAEIRPSQSSSIKRPLLADFSQCKNLKQRLKTRFNRRQVDDSERCATTIARSIRRTGARAGSRSLNEARRKPKRETNRRGARHMDRRDVCVAIAPGAWMHVARWVARKWTISEIIDTGCRDVCPIMPLQADYTRCTLIKRSTSQLIGPVISS